MCTEVFIVVLTFGIMCTEVFVVVLTFVLWGRHNVY